MGALFHGFHVGRFTIFVEGERARQVLNDLCGRFSNHGRPYDAFVFRYVICEDGVVFPGRPLLVFDRRNALEVACARRVVYAGFRFRVSLERGGRRVVSYLLGEDVNHP